MFGIGIGMGSQRRIGIEDLAVLEEALDGGFGNGAGRIEFGGGAVGAGFDGEAVIEVPGGELIELCGGEVFDAGDGAVFE